MHAESEGIGYGAGFIFTILAELGAIAERKPPATSRASRRRCRANALVVDDNATNRRILTLQTGKWGMTLAKQSTPSKPSAGSRSGDRFDLVITDMHMPEMDGLMFTEIRKLQDERALPIILLTSLGRRELGAEELNLFRLPDQAIETFGSL